MLNTLLFLLVIFVSCILQGITGFGFAVLAAPLGFLFFDQQTIVVVLTIISLVLNTFLLQKIKSKVDKKFVVKLLIPGLIGVPLGVIALTAIDGNILKLAAGILALVFVIILLFPRAKIKENNVLTVFVGALTGFLQSSIGLSGPPIVLVLTGYSLEVKQMRKTLAIVFLFLSIISLPLFLYKNILTWDRLLLGAMSIPLVIIGGNIGNKISDKVPKEAFRILTLLMVLAASIQVIYNVLSTR
jgi:uncharacterized membrane protein YfcA